MLHFPPNSDLEWGKGDDISNGTFHYTGTLGP